MQVGMKVAVILGYHIGYFWLAFYTTGRVIKKFGATPMGTIYMFFVF